MIGVTDHNQVGYNSPNDTLTDIYLNDDWNVSHVSWTCNISRHAHAHTHTHPHATQKHSHESKHNAENQTRHLYGVCRLWFLSASVLWFDSWETIFSILSFDPNRNHPEQSAKIPGCTNNTKQTPVSIATRELVTDSFSEHRHGFWWSLSARLCHTKRLRLYFDAALWSHYSFGVNCTL